MKNAGGNNNDGSDEFLVFGRPSIADAEAQEVMDCLRSGWLGTGPKVARFEADFRSYKEVSQAVAVNSCTAALHLSMLAAGLGAGDEVVTTPLTFCATINAIIHAGATPVLADVDSATMNIDPAEVRRRVTPRTRAILPVHFAGRPCSMDALLELADEQGLKIIEDCAHAVESEYHGSKIGTIGDFGCFSFYATKNVTAGEGGMVLTRREEDAARIKSLALHGLRRDAWGRFSDKGYSHYYVVDCGFKYNMMDLQAAIGIHQLKRVESSWRRRRQIWEQYDQAFADLPVERPISPAPATRHAFHLYTVLVDEQRAGITRDRFVDAMIARGIGVGVHYLSVPEHPYYFERFGWRPEDYPNAMRIGRQTVSLPLSPGLNDAEVQRVVEAVVQTLEG
jgi:dTDP-4-amino-4,6-dideoxygalactose transaminase